jgi:hypothetical protein
MCVCGNACMYMCLSINNNNYRHVKVTLSYKSCVKSNTSQGSSAACSLQMSGKHNELTAEPHEGHSPECFLTMRLKLRIGYSTSKEEATGGQAWIGGHSYGLDSSGSGQGPVGCSCKHGNEPSVYTIIIIFHSSIRPSGLLRSPAIYSSVFLAVVVQWGHSFLGALKAS